MCACFKQHLFKINYTGYKQKALNQAKNHLVFFGHMFFKEPFWGTSKSSPFPPVNHSNTFNFTQSLSQFNETFTRDI